MSKRLQILVEESEFDDIHRAARESGMTMSEWARDALRRERRRVSSGDVATKLAAIRLAAENEFPTGDIEQMLADIETGYTS